MIDQEIKKLIDGYGKWFLNEEIIKKVEMEHLYLSSGAIFEPIRINNMTVKNRLMMAPMDNICMCEWNGTPNLKMVKYFEERAKGGVGLIACGMVPICEDLDPASYCLSKTSPTPRIALEKENIEGWKNVVDACHRYDAKFLLQISPGLGRVGSPKCMAMSGRKPISASTNPCFYTPLVTCDQISDSDLKKIIHNAGQGAIASKKAGADGVYLHGHEGYLLDEMTNTAFNRRKDGLFADWQAFGLELIREIRNKVGDGYPIMYRIDLSLALNETYGEELMKTEALRQFTNGRTVKDTLNFMKNLVQAGVDAFDVDLGGYETWWLPHPPASMQPGCFIEVAEIVKNYFQKNEIFSNAGLNVPIVAVGKLGFPNLAIEALEKGKCDMIMLGRALLADADWPKKVASGNIQSIRPCIGCQEGCINEYGEDIHIQCAVNPRTGFEDVLPMELTPTTNPKKIAVVGAGPAGVVAAITAVKRGHFVTLFDKHSKVGGRIIVGSIPKIKVELSNYRNYLQHLVECYVEAGTLLYEKNLEVSAEFFGTNSFDSIIFATGSTDNLMKLPGMNDILSVQATELLKDPSLVKNVKKVVVIGGGVVGCETAYWLKFEKAIDVTVIEMGDYFMDLICIANRGHLIHYMQKAGVELLNATKAKSFCSEGVNVIRNISNSVPDPYLTWNPILQASLRENFSPEREIVEEEKFIIADMVVWAIGNKPFNNLFLECKQQRTARELINIGDSNKTGKIMDAVMEAYRIAIDI